MLSIGKLGAETGVKVPTIRYYEQIGLLPPAERSAGNQRLYSQRALDRLTFIRHARDLGFSLDAIRELLGLADNRAMSCKAVDAIARTHLTDVRARIRRLHALETELQKMLDHSAHGTIADCRVVEVLGNHALCADDSHMPVGDGQGRLDNPCQAHAPDLSVVRADR